MNAIVMTIAMCYALEEVKAVILRQQGRSALRDVERAALARLASAYLDSHPEIIERAAQTVRTCQDCAGWPNWKGVNGANRASAYVPTVTALSVNAVTFGGAWPSVPRPGSALDLPVANWL